VKRLLLFEAGYENFKEFFQCCYCQVLATIVVDSHLLHFGVLFDELPLLGFQRYFAIALTLLRRHLTFAAAFALSGFRQVRD
jgi:hypothetical protein